MARQTKTVHVDITGITDDDKLNAAKQLVRTYDGRVFNEDAYLSFVCCRIPRARLSHFKSTATKKQLSIDVVK